jgi:glutamine amidotransferase
MITIIDYGLGNLVSIKNMLYKVGFQSKITNDFDEISEADKIILPGVGAFDVAMKNIKSLGISEILRKKALVDKIPILGICLGMQIMTKYSEEGDEKGFGFFNAGVKRIQLSKEYKVPHMGWNYINIEKETPISINLFDKNKFYFVHSYYVECDDYQDILFSTQYGRKFTSGINKDNLYGVQFHPEKSHKFGMNILSNFAKI